MPSGRALSSREGRTLSCTMPLLPARIRLAGNAIVVSVEVRRVARLPSVERSRSCRTGGGTVPVRDRAGVAPARNLWLGAEIYRLPVGPAPYKTEAGSAANTGNPI